MSENTNNITPNFSDEFTIEDELELFDLNKVIAEITFILNPPEEMQILCDTALRVFETHYSSLVQVLHSLVESAIENHSSEKGAIVVFANELNDVFSFTVSDDGPGLPDEILTTIDKDIIPAESSIISQSGILMAKGIIEHFGGKISILSDSGKGTAIHFTWPK